MKHPRSYIPVDMTFRNRKVGDDFVTSYIKSFTFCKILKRYSIVRCHDDGRKTIFFSLFAVRKVEDPLSINCIAASIFFILGFYIETVNGVNLSHHHFILNGARHFVWKKRFSFLVENKMSSERCKQKVLKNIYCLIFLRNCCIIKI